MFEKLKKIILLTGHYGCGKTNFAVNLGLYYRRLGEETEILDLDIVNPYFRTADFSAMLSERGVSVIAPNFANSLLDLPSLPREVQGAFSKNGRVIADVGGDDAGAVVLGRYAADIQRAGGADMLYLFSVYRPGAGSAEELLGHIRAIEAVSRQRVTYLVNSSNLGAGTEYSDVERSLDFADEFSAFAGIPLLATAVSGRFADRVARGFAVERFVRLPWEREEDPFFCGK